MQTRTPGHIRILMCTCNGARFLAQQLDSFVAQTHPHWSLWVSDDGSVDDTRAMLERFGAQHPGRLERVIDGPRIGLARNYLTLLNHPDLPPGPVALSDQDDVWTPQKLARAATALGLADAPAAPARAYAARFWVTDAALAKPRLSADWPRGPSLGNAVVQNILSGHSLVLNAAALELVRRAGAPADLEHHDWWLYLLLSAAGCDIRLDLEPVLYYRQHGGNHFGDRRRFHARLRRLAMLGGARYRGWIAAHMAALSGCDTLLTPRARALLSAWRAMESLGPVARARRFHELGIVRQTRTETLAILLATLMGRV